MARHRAYLKNLETQKMAEREEVLINDEIEQEKKNKFREQADRQRKKIVQLKVDKEAVAEENTYKEAP